MMGLWNKLARPRAERAVSTYVHCYCRDQGRPGAYCSPVIRAGAAAGQLDFASCNVGRSTTLSCRRHTRHANNDTTTPHCH